MKSNTSVDFYLWSDGCSAQFRSKYIFALTFLFPESFNVTRYYKERHHRKGPMDGIQGCVNDIVYRTVMARREVIKSPKEFAECAQKLVRGIHCYYFPIGQVMEQPESIKTYHIVQACTSFKDTWLEDRSKASLQRIQLFYITSDTQAFHDQ